MTGRLTYKQAGVDIQAADAFVARIKDVTRATHGDRVVPATEAFAGLVRPDLEGMTRPLIAATCDGVGTKLLVAREYGLSENETGEGLGQDLVAMNVNDLLPVGAQPLLFMDYIATGKLDPEPLAAIIRGAAAACREAGCVLLGGETAEMPGLYKAGDFDLAGFAVGMVDEGRVPNRPVAIGDVAFALSSSGLHANGYSLARKALLERGGFTLQQKMATKAGQDRTLGSLLLEPTRIYVRQVLDLMSRITVAAGAHITGGGLLGRLQKLVGPGQILRVDPQSYPRPAIIDLVQRAGDVSDDEMARTFNMGLGYVVIVGSEGPDAADAVPCDAVSGSAGWLRVGDVVAGDANSSGVDLGYARA